MRYLVQTVLIAFLVIGISGRCAFKGHKEGCKTAKCGHKEKAKCEKMEKKEASAEKVTISQVPEPAKTEIEKLTAGGQIESIDKEIDNGKAIYEVKATVGGKDVGFDVAQCGTVMASEESVPFDSLPADVKAAAEKYFGSAQGLTVSKEVAGAKTAYEIEGTKAGTKVTLKLSDTGKILEEEKE